MRRIFLICSATLGLLASACGSDTSEGSGPLPTPEPAPTVAGVSIEVPESPIEVDVAVIGVPAGQLVSVRALPGVNQPVAGEVPPSSRVELLGETFQTEDGLIWRQVQADGVQGWMQEAVAYQAPGEDITDTVLAALGGATFVTSAEAGEGIGQRMAPAVGATRVVIVGAKQIAGTSNTTITVDLVGFQDDAIAGYRLSIASDQADGWRPASVRQAALCARGVSASGLCT